MSKQDDIIISTTPSLSNWEINKYLGVVTAHVVAGTNLFSDFFAGVSDIFGGRSGTYKKQLHSIKKEVIHELSDSAYRLGGNCIIGLTIDMDEISGRGKSMFMVTATGTAVIAKESIQKNEGSDSARIVDGIHIAALLENELYISNFRNKSHYDDSDLSHIVQNRIYELIPDIIDIINELEPYDDNRKLAIGYLEQIPSSELKQPLYDYISKNEKNQDFAIELIGEKYLLDYEKVIFFLRSEDDVVQKNGILLLKHDKEFYKKEDLKELIEIITILKESVQPNIRIDEKKKTFSDEIIKTWICKNSHKNDLSSNYCYSCSIDKYGFTSKEWHFDKIVENLLLRKQLLERSLG